jgi:hypothetical protein
MTFSKIILRALLAFGVIAIVQMIAGIFPDSVCWANFCEVTSEMFIFGAALTWLWGPPRMALSPALQRAA